MNKLRVNNTSGISGVHWDKSRARWRTKISYCGKEINLGSFKDFDDAKMIREGAEKALDTIRLLKSRNIKVLGSSTMNATLSVIIPEIAQEHNIKLQPVKVSSNSEPEAKAKGGTS